jgi:hypothetical protein
VIQFLTVWGIELEDPGDVVDREQRVGGRWGRRLHGRVTLARRPRRSGERSNINSTAKEVVEIRSISMHADDPIVEEVLRFEELPPGSLGSRRGDRPLERRHVGDGITFYDDEVLFCEGDLLGQTREQIRSLDFRRDCDWRQS